MQQLDIFEDSRDLQLRNDLAAAIAACDLAASRRAQARLCAECPGDAALPTAAALIAWLETGPARADAPDFGASAQALAARTALEAEMAPAAHRLMGPGDGARWLRGQWRRLAQQARSLPWAATQADGHAAALWLRAEAWTEAAAAVSGIASWRRIPQTLAWMVHARWREAERRGIDDVWALLAELCWLAPERAQKLLLSLADGALRKQVSRFEAAYDADGAAHWAWFPAWLLVDQPLLAGPLGGTEPTRHDAPERGLALVQALLRLERQGRHDEVVAHRRELRGLDLTLFTAYMQTR